MKKYHEKKYKLKKHLRALSLKKIKQKIKEKKFKMIFLRNKEKKFNKIKNDESKQKQTVNKRNIEQK